MAGYLFGNADPARGKLRTFLITAFQRGLADFRKASRREKRGGGNVVSLDLLLAEERFAAEPAAPAQECHDREWALGVLDAAVARLEQNYATTGPEAQFGALRPFLTDESDHDALCAQLAMSPGAARQAVHRLRERLGRALREEIASTLFEPTDAAVDQQLAAFREALGKQAGSHFLAGIHVRSGGFTALKYGRLRATEFPPGCGRDAKA